MVVQAARSNVKTAARRIVWELITPAGKRRMEHCARLAVLRKRGKGRAEILALILNGGHLASLCEMADRPQGADELEEHRCVSIRETESFTVSRAGAAQWFRGSRREEAHPGLSIPPWRATARQASCRLLRARGSSCSRRRCRNYCTRTAQSCLASAGGAPRLTLPPPLTDWMEPDFSAPPVRGLNQPTLKSPLASDRSSSVEPPLAR